MTLLYVHSVMPVEVLHEMRCAALRVSKNNEKNNQFTSQTPFSVNLTHLTDLFLEHNDFSGKSPASLPSSLASTFPSTASTVPFWRCFPLSPTPHSQETPTTPSSQLQHRLPPPSRPRPHRVRSPRSSPRAPLLQSLSVCPRRCVATVRRRQHPAKLSKLVMVACAMSMEVGISSSKEDITRGSAEAEMNKLVFFEGGIYSFDLEDLLRASAEVEEGTTVVFTQDIQNGANTDSPPPECKSRGFRMKRGELNGRMDEC
ncbi:hypothetical protein V8G54_024356 [Vigna mungo]|uniref:Uncharacterized protein n=1 Tax=Vigna mungo TaxID=3915 RepID=A0AAQ3N6Y0_VIGMU